MNSKISKILLSLFLIIVLVSLSFAQRQTGSLTGKVVDNEGGPLPGVTVVLTGSSLMGTLTYITTDTGDFRFPAIPPGRDYCLEFELPGFQKSQKTGIICNVGKTFRVDVIMNVTALEEEITVTAVAPTVDVTSSKQSVTYTTELINNIPLARNYGEIIQTAPGVVGGGDSPRSHGSGYRTSLVSIDGATITDRVLGSQGLQLPFDILDEVELEVGGHPAEIGMTEGAYVNIVSKSGGNEFHGSALAYFFNEDMARSLIPESEVKAVGLGAPTGVKQLYDMSATLGGPIIKDKLWFFTNGRFSGTRNRQETYQDGEYDRPLDEIWGFLKLTFQLTDNLKLTTNGSLRNYDQPLGYYDMSYYRNKYSARYLVGAKDYVASGMVNWIIDQNSFLDIRFGAQGIFYPRYFHPDFDLPPTDQPMATQDRGDVPLYYGPCRWEDELNRYQLGGSISFNHFMDNVLGGNHEWKAGMEYEKAWVDNPIWTPYPIAILTTYNGLPWGYHDAVPYMGYFQSNVIGDIKENWNLRVYGSRWAAYIQDSFTLKDRLTFNLGLRYNHSSGYTKAQKLYPVGRLSPVLTMLAPSLFKEVDFHAQDDMIVWNNFSPRVGIAYDLFGDNTTSLKASWSRYSLFMVMEYYISLSPAMPHRPFLAYWYDLDKDGIMETTDDYNVVSQPPDIENFDWRDLADPDLEPPYTDEYIVGVEREVAKDFSVSVSYIHKRWHKAMDDVEINRGYTPDSEWWIPYTTTDPGEDGKFGTGDEQEITVYGVKAGAPASKRILANPEGFKKKYHGVEFVFTKRMSSGWQLLSSVTISKTEGNMDSGSTSGFTSAFDTPNYLINNYGPLSWDVPVMIKIQGSVELPLGFMVSGYYTYFGGRPFARTLQIQLPNDPDVFEYPGTFADTVNAEVPGTRRYASETNLDLRMEKAFGIASFGRLGLFVDILNVFGARGYNITQNPGGRLYNDGTFTRHSSYGRFTGAYGLRTFKLSVRFTF